MQPFLIKVYNWGGQSPQAPCWSPVKPSAPVKAGPLKSQWRGHQEKGPNQVVHGEQEKWKLEWPRKIFKCLVLDFRHFQTHFSFLYISFARQRFDHGNTKTVFFLTQLFFIFCLYFRQRRRSLGGGTTQFTGGAKTRGGGQAPPGYGIERASSESNFLFSKI